MKKEELINFLQDGDLITFDGEEDKFTFNKSKMILERYEDTPFPLEIEKVNPDTIINIERLQSVYKVD